MNSPKLSQSEAERLLNMLKKTLKGHVGFPQKGDKEEFKVIGDYKRDEFTISIFRSSIHHTTYNIGGRIDKNGVSLLELHINPTTVHTNPDGEKITGSHWHIYTEEHGRRLAVPAEGIEDDEFVKTTIHFLEKFKVVEKPEITYQIELV